jgi:hypothetical protein
VTSALQNVTKAFNPTAPAPPLPQPITNGLTTEIQRSRRGLGDAD